MALYDAIPVAVATQEVEVVAPATLVEGYEFEAQYEGKTFTVTVPKGGVTKGQKFMATIPTKESAVSPDLPLGHWKDGLCDCCMFGCCHPSCCIAAFCQPILWGQIMTRMKLTWLASPGLPAEVAKTFTYISAGYIIWIVLFSFFGQNQVTTTYTDPDTGNTTPFTSFVNNPFGNFLNFLYFLFILYIGTKTRYAVRKRYNIPTGQCGDCEDLACVWCCSCCTVSQLARATADYETTPPSWCSETGLQRAMPVVEV